MTTPNTYPSQPEQENPYDSISLAAELILEKRGVGEYKGIHREPGVEPEPDTLIARLGLARDGVTVLGEHIRPDSQLWLSKPIGEQAEGSTWAYSIGFARQDNFLSKSIMIPKVYDLAETALFDNRPRVQLSPQEATELAAQLTQIAASIE